MIELARLEGNEIVIRINVANIRKTMDPTFAYLYGPYHDLVIKDTNLFIKEFIDILNEEDHEDGNSLITSMLDSATMRLVEGGSETIDYRDSDLNYYEMRE